MNQSLNRRAASIRDYLHKQDDLNIDPLLLNQFSGLLAIWDGLRLLVDKAQGTPADDRRLLDLQHRLEAMSDEIGLGAHLTDSRGFLGRDPARIICHDWREAASGW